MFTKSVSLVMMRADFTGLLGTQKVLEPNKVQKVLTNDHSPKQTLELSVLQSGSTARKALFPPLKKVDFFNAHEMRRKKVEERKLHLSQLGLLGLWHSLLLLYSCIYRDTPI